jgi:hypothetical protein
VLLRGSSRLYAQSLSIQGDSISNPGNLVGILNPRRAPNPDPLRHLPEPTPGTAVLSDRLTVGTGTTVTVNAGYYPGGFNVRGTLIMNPGIYIIDDDFSGNSLANITGNGVMIFLRNGAALDFASEGLAFTLNPPDTSIHNFAGADTYKGICIFQARNNSATSKIPLAGNAQCNGTIYLPLGQLDITASGGNGGVKAIVYRLYVNGTADVAITGLNDTWLEGTPYLVE